jgi:hypothetical protein
MMMPAPGDQHTAKQNILFIHTVQPSVTLSFSTVPLPNTRSSQPIPFLRGEQQRRVIRFSLVVDSCRLIEDGRFI